MENRNNQKSIWKSSKNYNGATTANPNIKKVYNSYHATVLIEEPIRQSQYPVMVRSYRTIPYEGVPFYIVQLGYMKTIYNLIRDIIEFDSYFHFEKKEAGINFKEYRINKSIANMLKAKEPSSTHENYYKIFDYFERVVNGKPLPDDCKFEFPADCSMIQTYDLNGNKITWYPSIREKYEKHNSTTIIDKQLLDTISKWIRIYIENNKTTVHQSAAIAYLFSVTSNRPYMVPLL